MQTRKIFKQNQHETAYNFAQQVRRLREERGLTIEEVSARSRIPLFKLQRMETGYFADWGRILNYAKFFDRKIRIEFY